MTLKELKTLMTLAGLQVIPEEDRVYPDNVKLRDTRGVFGLVLLG